MTVLIMEIVILNFPWNSIHGIKRYGIFLFFFQQSIKLFTFILSSSSHHPCHLHDGEDYDKMSFIVGEIFLFFSLFNLFIDNSLINFDYQLIVQPWTWASCYLLFVCSKFLNSWWNFETFSWLCFCHLIVTIKLLWQFRFFNQLTDS